MRDARAVGSDSPGTSHAAGRSVQSATSSVGTRPSRCGESSRPLARAAFLVVSLLLWLGLNSALIAGDVIFEDGFEFGECSGWSASSNPLGAPDVDSDTYGDALSAQAWCSLPPGHVGNATDCDDNDPSVHPGAVETCNGSDDDCDAEVDEFAVCDDGIACTSDVCDSGLGACTAVPHNELCACGETCLSGIGCSDFCEVRLCQGVTRMCGDCIDNDGDCAVDAADSECLGACDNSEDGLHWAIPGGSSAPCTADCHFDGDTGAGNDDCRWTHKCDPLEVEPDYPPEGIACAYDPEATVPGSGATCLDAATVQSAACFDFCAPLVPNGCDCFGCCAVPGAPTPIWLGSAGDLGTGTCTLASLGDPALCRPCTQVSACLNPCAECELCVGKTTLEPGCTEQACAPGLSRCGLPAQPYCGTGLYCVSGCCQPLPV